MCMKNNAKISDQPISDARSKEFKQAVERVEKNEVSNQNIVKNENLMVRNRVLELIKGYLGEGMKIKQLAKKTGHSDKYFFNLLKNPEIYPKGFFPKKQKFQERLLKKLVNLENSIIGEANKSDDGGENAIF